MAPRLNAEPRLLSSVDSLLDPEVLRTVLGVSAPIRVEPLDTLGYSGSRFFGVTVEDPTLERSSFIVKRTVLSEDWFSQRTGDRVGREAAVLSDPRLGPIHRIFHLPYRAIAVEAGRFALLMKDVSRWLFPDERAPLAREDEDLILETLARLHATFWEAPALDECPWLQASVDFLHIMGPRDHDPRSDEGGSARRVDEAIRTGWRSALESLPEAVRRALCRPAGEIAAPWSHLPTTLVHGDAKVANFAILPGRKVCAFDWAFAGRAPATFELGWYLAVNASRLSRSKERTLRRYRGFLETHLGRELEDGLWGTLEEAGVVCGALMLLWAKGTAVASGRPEAQVEWAWWEERLRTWAGRAV